ncbi:MAG: hypothetical protein K2K45_03160 [Muribaculaceae bacterium]|nr:hypothetical protein [Muribaculaceae bacterium]
MSRQRIFTKDFVDTLSNSVEDNMIHYKNPDFNWLEFAEEQKGTHHVPIEIPEDLCDRMLTAVPPNDAKNKARYDFEAAKILFEAFPNLSPLQVAQREIWVFLSHCVLMPYVRKRWEKIDEEEIVNPNYIKEHWLYGQGVVRNWLHGLYWSVYATVERVGNNGADFDYTLTERLFTHQNIRSRGVAAAPFLMSNRAPLQGLMNFLAVHESDIFNKYMEYRIDACVQLLNNAGGVVDLTVWDKNDFFSYLERCKNIILAVEDRKKQRKALREQLN